MAVFPCRIEGAKNSTIVLADPTDAASVRVVELTLGEPVALPLHHLRISRPHWLNVSGRKARRYHRVAKAAAAQLNDDIDSLRDLASGAPVMRAVNDLIEKAVELRATDIHIEPFRTGLIIRLRVDGLLQVSPTPPRCVVAGANFQDQDFRGVEYRQAPPVPKTALHICVWRDRISIFALPRCLCHSESVVIRLLPKDRAVLEITKLRLSNSDQSKIRQTLAQPRGMIIITGPMGSGKTTNSYAPC